jgi:hypothetical protein
MKKSYAILVLAVCLGATAQAQTSPPAPASEAAAPQARPATSPPAAAGGNKALMDEWAARRRQVRDKVLDRLREQGKVPRDGTVEFEARFRPDPRTRPSSSWPLTPCG